MSWQGRRGGRAGWATWQAQGAVYCATHSPTGRRCLPTAQLLARVPFLPPSSALQHSVAPTRPRQHPPWAPHPLHCPPAPADRAAQPGQSRHCCRRVGGQAGRQPIIGQWRAGLGITIGYDYGPLVGPSQARGCGPEAYKQAQARRRLPPPHPSLSADLKRSTRACMRASASSSLRG